ncbi:MAG: FAD:protein FMN transferase [Rhodobacteraceae bacterium]|nr:FAD:protein FMN transferase [Paracoccaceae bacterium]
MLKAIACFFFLPVLAAHAHAEQIRGNWEVMGTYFSVTLLDTAPSRANDEILGAAFSVVDILDRQMSNYRPDSELSRVNDFAGRGQIQVQANLYEILLTSELFRASSAGAFDVTIGALVDAWGFYSPRTASIPEGGVIARALESVGEGRLKLRAAKRTVELKSGTRLDLGAVAKGYAVDRAIAVLRERGAAAAMVDLGGTVGVIGSKADGEPWSIGIRHPAGNGLIGKIRIARGAVSTSGNYERFFIQDGKRFSHLIDPRTGWPVAGVMSVTVVAPSATTADALSTAAYVRAPQDGIAWLGACDGVKAIAFYPADDDQIRVEFAGAGAEALFELSDADCFVKTESAGMPSSSGAKVTMGSRTTCAVGSVSPPATDQ